MFSLPYGQPTDRRPGIALFFKSVLPALHSTHPCSQKAPRCRVVVQSLRRLCVVQHNALSFTVNRALPPRDKN